MARRKHTPVRAETEVLTQSRRRCCICFALKDDRTEKRGQIAHLDGNPQNADCENLAWLCLDHHDQFDGSTSQSKSLTIQEVKNYREVLYSFIQRQSSSDGQENLQTVQTLITRYEELLSDRDRRLVDLRLELERATQLKQQLEQALRTAESDAAALRELRPKSNLIPDALSSQLYRRMRSPQLLLIEPHRETGRIMAKMLTSIGYGVHWVRKAAAAREAIARCRMDVVVSELNLPNGEAFTLMRELKDLRHVPGIAVTGFGLEEDRAASKKAGFADHLLKPVNIETLHQAVQRVLLDDSPDPDAMGDVDYPEYMY